MIQTEYILTTVPVPLDHSSTFIWRWISFAALLLLFAGLAWRQHRFVDRYSANVMVMDQWDFYKPMAGTTWWGDFDEQHGPHRMGVGMLLTRKLADISHMNTRWDSFAVSFLLMGATALAMALAWLCGVRQPLAMLAIPLLFLNRRQYQHFVTGTDISHAGMPMFMFMLYCLCWFVRLGSLRLILLTVLTFCLIFTGFGIFVGVITPVILFIEAVQSARAKQYLRCLMIVGSLVLVGASWGLFFSNYNFAQATANTNVMQQKPTDIVNLFAAMLANNFAIRGDDQTVVLFGLAVAAILTCLCAYHGLRLMVNGVLNERRSVVIFCLSAYTLIYCADTAAGRAYLGWRAAAGASRYITLMVPGGLAILLQLATLKPVKMALGLSVAYAVFIAWGSLALTTTELADVNQFHDGLLRWKDAYLMTHDDVAATKQSGFVLYPTPGAISDRLVYLEQHHLNMFYNPPQR